jgi:hypothetical protein
MKDLEINEILQASFWHGPSSHVGKPTDVMLAPHQQGNLLDLLSGLGVEITEYISDVQRYNFSLTLNTFYECT